VEDREREKKENVYAGFDRQIDRRETGAYKWSGGRYGLEEDRIIPMWVADMDFACPEPVVTAVKERAAHPLYGYTVRDQGYEAVIAGWMKRRYGFEPREEWLAFAPPGVLYAIYTMLRILTEKGDGVLVLMPNYDPLHEVVTKSGRRLAESLLSIKDGKIEIDFDDLESKLAGDVKVMIISNPHNPSGRVWRREELQRVAELCGRYGVFVISDEIHADFVSQKYGHTAFPSLGEEAALNCMACYSANKGFNLGGLQTSTLVIADPEKRRAFDEEMGIGQTRLDNIFGITATRAAYSDPLCEKWLDEAIEYVDGNKELVYDYLRRYVPEIRAVRSEGTYLMWLDCSALGMDGKELERFFLESARVQPCMGYEFGGQGGSGDRFVRLNTACPRTIVMAALDRIKNAVSGLRGGR